MCCYSNLVSTAKYLIDEKMKSIKAQQNAVDEPSEVTAGLLTYLLSTEMSLEEMYGNISELMLAAVDTVICSLCFRLLFKCMPSQLYCGHNTSV